MKMPHRKVERYFGKFFSVMVVTIFLTISILSIILYMNFEKIALRQSYDQTMGSLAQTTQEASVMAVTAATFAKQIHSDQNVANLLNFPDVSALDIAVSIRQLTNYRETSPFIESIYVYNAEARTFYVSSDMNVPSVFSEPEFYDQELRSMLQHVNDYNTLMPIPRKLRIDGLVGNIAERERDTYTFLLYDTLSKKSRKNAVVVNIKETQLHKHIDGSLTNAPTNTFLIDENGTLVTNSWKTPMLSSLKGTTYIDRILRDPEGSGYFAAEVDHVKSLITYSRSDYLGWRYIRIVPYSVISQNIDSMRTKTMIVAGGILLAGLALSSLLSRRIFSGLNHKLSRLGKLETEQRESVQAMRMDYLRSLLKGYTQMNARHAADRFERYSIPLDPLQPVRVLLIMVDDHLLFVNRYKAEDRKLLIYGVLNIAQELFAAAGIPATAADIGDEQAAVLLQMSGDAEGDRERCKESASWIQTAVSEYLKLSVTVSSSLSGPGVEAVHALYQQAVEASYSWVFSGAGSHIEAEEVEQNKTKRYEYPLHKEKQMIDELMLGRIADVRQLFREIIVDTAAYTYISYQFAVSHLIFALQNALRIIRSHSPSNEDWEFINLQLYMPHSRTETMEQFIERCMFLFDQLENQMNERKKSRQDELPGRIKKILDERYADPNLSLDMLAEELGMSATYIGRVFKQHTLQTILGYIQKVRMSRVRELLLHTDAPVGEIAERAGFSNSPYFFKAFKKYNGVTPAEYRRTGRGRTDDDGVEAGIAAD
ncbi:helix-turn-helix domain-containing protein [Paenibacillus etheri]|uniref:HTH araC/xylS-type domain-containing protein n=1 Tax=Paenibacillus etheri TaxID=1306852 RepID=A0A0W1AY22_9BACL|nr:helix-turn-helix domain-containing protein [Paenibacillus etheri]KTD86201.1 hypothetical protein UQ64_17235 [Paenibacillus etheri]